MIRRLCLLLLGVLGIGILLAAPAAAHATVVTSDPRDGARLASAPRSVTITFDESVGIGFLHVTNSDGARVDARGAFHPGSDGTMVADQLRTGLGDGTYTASFRITSADGHPVAGTVRFVVGNGALVHGAIAGGNAVNGTTRTTFDVLRWVSYAGLALLGGAWLLFTIWPAGRTSARARTIVWTGWGAAVVGALGEVLLQGPYTAGGGLGAVLHASMLDDTLHTRYGLLHCVRLIALGALAVLLSRTLDGWTFDDRTIEDRTLDDRTLDDRTFDDRDPRWAGPVAAVLGVGVLATFAGDGHASTTSPSWLSMPVDGLHLAAMAVWLGGLVVLVAAVLPRRDPVELAFVLPWFSTVAFCSVVVLAASGTYAAWRGIGTVHAIFTTTYGLLVVAKIVLFIGLLGLGNMSRLLVRRRATALAATDAALREPKSSDGVETERLRRSVLVEVVLGVAVLALTSVLVAEPRGKEALAADYRRPVSTSTSLGGGRSVTVTVDPGVHGQVDVTVMLHGGAAQTITATATQHHAEIGPLPITLTSHGGGHYDGTVALPVAGSWDVDLVVTTSEFDATTADVSIDLH